MHYIIYQIQALNNDILLLNTEFIYLSKEKKMKSAKLSPRIDYIRAAGDFQHKLIDTIYFIMSLKKKAEVDYRTSLQNINNQLQKYIVSDNGFLTQMMKTFQSYIAITVQNQTALIEGYQSQILLFLKKAKESKLEDQIIKKVQFVDSKVDDCIQKIKYYKKLIKQNEEDLQILNSEIALKNKLSFFGEDEKKKLNEKYEDIHNLKNINEESLQNQVVGMMEITMQHNETLEELNQYEGHFLGQKGLDVYDNFVRVFIFEVSYNRNMQNDVTSILTRLNDQKQQNKKIAFDNLISKMNEKKGITDSLWQTYKSLTTAQVVVDINQPYISPRIKEKWSRVCQYYNQAAV